MALAKEVYEKGVIRENKETHIWLDEVPGDCLTTWVDTFKAHERDEDIIHTTNIHFCSWRYYRRIFVHVEGQCHEIKVGTTEGCEREIRATHNLEKMLLSNEFDWFSPDNYKMPKVSIMEAMDLFISDAK